MPFIEYHCENCGNDITELFLTFSYPQEIECTKCGEIAKKLEVPTKAFTFNATELAQSRK